MSEQILLEKKKYLSGRRIYWWFKRTQDIVLSLGALFFLSPVFLIIALMIYIDDPAGSAFFSQTRIGRKGKPFRFWKFRSMCMDAEARLASLQRLNEMDGPVFKMKDDPRITKIGKFLRRTSLDELPQLWNVLKGDMSIVGPRPALPREVEQYTEYQRQRLLVTPGLTCIWQIQPHRNSISFEEWVEMDIEYVKKRSLMMDWKLIWGTVVCMLRKSGV